MSLDFLLFLLCIGVGGGLGAAAQSFRSLKKTAPIHKAHKERQKMENEALLVRDVRITRANIERLFAHGSELAFLTEEMSNLLRQHLQVLESLLVLRKIIPCKDEYYRQCESLLQGTCGVSAQLFPQIPSVYVE